MEIDMAGARILCFSLLTLFCVTSVISQDAECEGVEDTERVDCGVLGTEEEDCVELDCCWEEQPEGTPTPWCYYRPSNPCLSGPCINGDCVANGTGYRCDCYPGYLGENCDELDESICSATDRELCTGETAVCFELGCCYDPEIDFCYLWAGGPRGPEGENCVVEIAVREPCGPGDGEPVRMDSCIDIGCCWDPVSTEGAAWCFYSAGSSFTTEAPTLDPSCVVADNARDECGFSGITDSECEEQGCCWAEPRDSAPWCFYKNNGNSTLTA